MTKGITVGSTVTIISTHILTKRMTQSKHGSRKWQLNFNSHPHEEDDHHPLLSYTSQYHFNSHPHEEDDLWGLFRCPPFHISTHILTKRMTYICTPVRYAPIYFNSHPHEEDDESPQNNTVELSFQLTSSRRG